MMKKKTKDSKFIIALDKNRFVQKDQIDCIMRTNKVPDSTDSWDVYKYVIFLKNSRYNWMAINETEFNKYLSPYIMNLM